MSIFIWEHLWIVLGSWLKGVLQEYDGIFFLKDAFIYQMQNKGALRIRLQILMPIINIQLL